MISVVVEFVIRTGDVLSFELEVIEALVCR